MKLKCTLMLTSAFPVKCIKPIFYLTLFISMYTIFSSFLKYVLTVLVESSCIKNAFNFNKSYEIKKYYFH